MSEPMFLDLDKFYRGVGIVLYQECTDEVEKAMSLACIEHHFHLCFKVSSGAYNQISHFIQFDSREGMEWIILQLDPLAPNALHACLQNIFRLCVSCCERNSKCNRSRYGYVLTITAIQKSNVMGLSVLPPETRCRCLEILRKAMTKYCDSAIFQGEIFCAKMLPQTEVLWSLLDATWSQLNEALSVTARPCCIVIFCSDVPQLTPSHGRLLNQRLSSIYCRNECFSVGMLQIIHCCKRDLTIWSS